MNKQQEDWKERVNVILVQLTDEMGYDYTTKRLTAFKKAEQAIYSLIFQARKEAKIEMLTDVEQSFQNGREESEVDDEEENKKLQSKKFYLTKLAGAGYYYYVGDPLNANTTMDAGIIAVNNEDIRVDEFGAYVEYKIDNI